MKKFLVIIVMLAIGDFVVAQPLHHRVRVWLDDKPFQLLAQTGIDLIECVHKGKTFIESDFSEDELSAINAAGFRTEIRIENVSEYYRTRNKDANTQRINSASCSQAPDFPVPANFLLGSMSGFFTYQEMLDNLDMMATLYPNLITIKQPASTSLTTIEGNDIFYVRISDNPNVNEAEPELLYTALHHAREPNGMSAIIYYMWYLLENYASDPSIQGLVNNTEMYFIPCINVDGYLYNQLTDPSGGGLWRKNRRDFQTGVYGVDLNRNYGNQWGYDDLGSSPDSTSAVFRGQGPFSEPETQIIRDFCNAHEFKLALNYHTYSNLLINPWGYIDNFYTPDSSVFISYAKEITRYNNYSSGTANQTVNYSTNGSSDDWMYGEQLSKAKIFAFTPEIGSYDDGFWPAINRIIPLCQENMYANLTAARLAGRYGVTDDTEDRYLGTGNSYFNFDFKLLGLDTIGIFTVSISSLTPQLLITGSPKVFTGLHLLQSVSDSIGYAFSGTLFPGDEVKYTISINNGIYTTTDTLVKIYGNPVTLINDDCSTNTNWSSLSAWDFATNYFVSPSTSFTDSPSGLYLSSDFNELLLNGNVDLTNAIRASANFYARWDIEKESDYAQLQVSVNNGATWTPVCGKYTNDGTVFQGFGEPVYDNKQLSWVREEINLDGFVGNNLTFKFVMASDQFLELDGFYFDDFLVRKINVSPVGVNDNEMVLSEPFPNPASDEVTITYHTQTSSLLSIYNAAGQVVFEKTITADQNEIKLNTGLFAAGVYHYVLSSTLAKSQTQKLIIHH